jgi:hypothetical protein
MKKPPRRFEAIPLTEVPKDILSLELAAEHAMQARLHARSTTVCESRRNGAPKAGQRLEKKAGK